mmetsp:Transcript_65413/g.116056  ORF Transcript_65413/g.116056 Transcript_65413/m.116056 type:complete len:775 (+) Transcript_65413:65-2389(+)|eukprot:CAMPEP_0197671950 /NCGR_PEP_ID=MMETSP1338-20131121/77790_1 /TAXON_ID=43686 ORGANISM="Pelagodinium beii, Strain RCC1491" /NCGR_SAMPLE_ID=MMETSP1338 /ASSEMBLY_ACC=CAM_ASM_000754 /LENGTH=774 /DNA_ID=CAMNT_0043251949 /DNA_START=38 /DNA_END=2362 /DNA_ORIENTATION=+
MAESVVVGVRVRPFNDRERGLNAEVCIDMQGPTTTIKNVENAKDDEGKSFTFDESFWSHDGFEDDGTGYMKAAAGSKYADQRHVFDTFGQRVLDNAWEGFHCCLFAYGQTGAGKSYSMVGYANNQGIVPISCEEIFRRISAETKPDVSYEVTVSMIEIYNEAIQDLLIMPEARPKQGLDIRESKALGIYIDGVIRRPVQSYTEIESTINEATNHRTVGSTLMNATSSRAHTVQIIEFKQVKGGQTTVSMVNLVDLAGSEKAGQTGATGDRLKEGSAINKSLSALGNVIEKLAQKSSGKGKNVLIPYRDSKLTRLLQNALGGSSKTIMICALSPASSNYEETLSTLRYADRAKKIKNNAVVNENPQQRLMRELQEENAKLKEMISSLGNGNMPDAASLQKMSESQAEIAACEAALVDMNKSFEQKQAEAIQMKEKAELTWRQMRAGQRWNALVQKMLSAAERGEERRSTLKQASDPFISNLNEDSTLVGRIRHEFPPGRSMIGNERYDDSDSENDEQDSEDEKDSDSDSESDSEPDESPDIVLKNDNILRRHAVVMNEDGCCTVWAANEPASHQIFLNGRSISCWSNEYPDDMCPEDRRPSGTKELGYKLKHGDRVVMGFIYFIYVDPTADGGLSILQSNGKNDFFAAKQEWQQEQSASLLRRFRTNSGNEAFFGSAAKTGLTAFDVEIEAQRQEIQELVKELSSVRKAIQAEKDGTSTYVQPNALPAEELPEFNFESAPHVFRIKQSFEDMTGGLRALESFITNGKPITGDLNE